MTKTVLFVHGTGVRKASYEVTAARIMQGLHGISPSLKLEACLWGDPYGARLGQGGASIPKFAPLASAAPDTEQQKALWELLARDPLFELRELTASSGGLVPLVARATLQALPATMQALSQDAALLALLSRHAPSLPWQEAVSAVVGSAALRGALTAAKGVDTPLRLALARAMVASLQQALLDNNVPPLPIPLRDRLVNDCIDKLGGRDLGGFTDWVTGKLYGLGLRLATAKARRERDALFSAASPTAGDVVMYQARGARIRDYIAERIALCGDDVVVIAHSLGGIACVDLLVERALPQVKLLVTVGSQAPFLYEIDALSSLPFGKPLPEHFPARWVNFYDCDDLLSYAASRVFAGRATDHEVRSGQPFPLSHSAYWDTEVLWKTLAVQLK